jgi:hypothetical protein
LKWSDVLGQVTDLIEKPLKSISGRSDITLVHFDTVSYVVKRTDGKQIMTKLQELRELVTALSKRKPIHVDALLHGSGSSRSHPETVLANLPGVEWKRIQGRKHIVWVDHPTHAPGTLREH